MSQLPNKDQNPAGKSPIFPTTHWSAIHSAGQEDERISHQAMTVLLEKYCRPMEVYVGMKFGSQLHNAKLEVVDLVQEFVHDRILQGEILKGVDPDKCNRFRNFLQTCLSNYVQETIRTTLAKKRSTTHQTVPIEDHDLHSGPNHTDEASAALAMDQLWAESLFMRCVSLLRQQFEKSKRTKAWQLFEERFLKPFMHGTPPASYKDLASQLGYPSNKAAADAMREIKDQWQRLVRQEISDYIIEKELIEQELRHLITCLSQSKGELPL